MRRLLLAIATSRALASRKIDDLLGLGGVGDHLERVAHFGQPIEAQNFDGRGRARLRGRLRPGRRTCARTLPKTEPQMKWSPTLSVPLRTSTVATGPRPRSSLASSTVPSAGTRGIGPQVLHFGDQQDHFEQLSRFCLRLGRDGDHDDVAAPVFGEQAAVGQLLLDALGLRRRACRSC